MWCALTHPYTIMDAGICTITQMPFNNTSCYRWWHFDDSDKHFLYIKLLNIFDFHRNESRIIFTHLLCFTLFTVNHVTCSYLIQLILRSSTMLVLNTTWATVSIFCCWRVMKIISKVLVGLGFFWKLPFHISGHPLLIWLDFVCQTRGLWTISSPPLQFIQNL